MDGLEINVRKMIWTSEGKIPFEIKTCIPKSKISALYGDSGTGKTTLLRMIAGLLSPDEGTIIYNGNLWFDSRKKINVPSQKRSVGFMFQDFALFPNMNVKENIEYAQKEKDKDFLDAILETFGLSNLWFQKPAQLSGGQKQRVALARVLAQKPAILLLDEPLSALDFSMRRSLQAEIVKAHSISGSTTLFVSHDIEEILRLSSFALHVKSGKIDKAGPPLDILLSKYIMEKVCVN